eukprot:7445491-Ditylum_brightwellii.AAC.1
MSKSPEIEDFKGGLTDIEGVGIVRWWFEDDMGKVTYQDIRYTLFVQEVPYNILSPQHWLHQSSNDHSGWKFEDSPFGSKYQYSKVQFGAWMTKCVVSCTLLGQQICIIDQEYVLFPATVVSDDENLVDTAGQSAATDQEEGIVPVTGVADHLKDDHNTSFDTSQQESSNSIAPLSHLTRESRDTPHTADDKHFQFFVRDHPPLTLVIPQEEGESNQLWLIKLN